MIGKLVAIMLLLNPTLGVDRAREYAGWIAGYCDSRGAAVMPYIMFVESSFNERVVSYTGDYGLTQVSFDLWSPVLGLANPSELLEAETAIWAGCEVLKRVDDGSMFWWARYHSRTPNVREAYVSRVLRAKQRVLNTVQGGLYE